MSDEDRIGEILRAAAETHHQVYRINDGADPDWASWYADWLVRLSALPGLLGRRPSTSELVWLLVGLDRQYTVDKPGVSWDAFYANAIMEHFGRADDEVRIEPYAGDRDALRGLFALAEDSDTQLDSYLGAGRVLIAQRGADIVGHLQLVDTERPDTVEIKSMAVREPEQGRGVGTRLIRAALELAATEGRSTAVVSTATADTANLRFYQRQGFRFRSVDRDAFTPATGYPTDIRIDGIQLRDRIWLDRPIEAAP